MKIKGISVFERHIEKFVFALFFLALLGVFGAQFFIPSEVKVGSQTVDPAGAGKIAADKARLKVNELESQSVHAEVPAEIPDLRALYREAASSDGSPEQVLAFGAPQLNIEGGAASAQDDPTIDLPDGVELAEFVPPAASRPLATTMGATLDPRFVEDAQTADPGFKNRLGLDDQPFDVRGISIETTIDTQRLRSRLSSLQKLWWDGRVELLDVEVMRQQMLPDGSWSNPETVAKAPGQRSLADAVQNPEFSPADLRQLLDEEDSIRDEIRNPKVMPSIAGAQWIPPSMAQEREVDFAEITPEERRIQRLLDQLERTRSEIDRLRNKMDSSAHAPSSQPVYYYAQRGGGGVGGGRDNPRNTEGGGGIDSEQIERERQKKIKETQQKRLDKLTEQEDKLVDDIIALGGNPNGAPQVEPINPEDFIQPTDSLTAALHPEMTLWAHDFDAVPGTTYRYAVRYWATNPFFGKAADLDSKQKDLANGVAVVSELSEWTDPVYFAPSVQYFVASARPAQRGQFGASASAEFEVYQFYYGYWRRGIGRVGAGESIRAEIELPEGLVLFVPNEEDPGAEPAEVPVDPAAVRRSVDAYLMDVLAGVAGQDSAGALIATSGGEVLTRSPDTDAVDPTRERLAASAEQGLTAGSAALDPAARPGPRKKDDRDGGRDGGRDDGRGGGPGMGRERR